MDSFKEHAELSGSDILQDTVDSITQIEG